MSRKLTLNEMYETARIKGGMCLSKRYINSKTKLKWRCNQSHVWEALPTNVLKGHWCLVCSFEKNASSKRLGIDEMKELAKLRGGKCLSTEYKNNTTRLKWKCEKGHVWEATPSAIKLGRWCHYCSGWAKDTLENVQKMAKKKGGVCLSKSYVNARTKLWWQCSEEHRWQATSDSVKSEHWCPVCALNKRTSSRRLGIKEMKDLAKKRGGRCLSEKYTNTQTKLKWQCKKGHIWEALPLNVKNKNSWCPICFGRGKTIKDMQKLAKRRNGKCLSKNYLGANKKLRWQCNKRHKWLAAPNHILSGRWCPRCSYIQRGDNLKDTIEEMQEIARKRKGECLSKKYLGQNHKLQWKCIEGHIWTTTPQSIKNGSWCSICSQGVSERICRKYFENIFKEKFPKSRPKWLKTDQNVRLELDGYCKKLRLAFEYHGQQHYEALHFFTRKRTFYKQKALDAAKRRLCKKNEVTLIEVPYTVDYENMEKYIVTQCRKKGIKVPKIIKEINYRLFNIYSLGKIKELQKVAKEKGGRLLSKRYINTHTKLEWKCSEGHRWNASPINVKRGSWCPICAGNTKMTVLDLQNLAKSFGGKCLSKRVLNTRIAKLKWKCKKGHVWKATVRQVKWRKKWCSVCAKIANKNI